MEYKINCRVTTEQFIQLLRNSTLAERRPVDDRDCMEKMLQNSNLCVTAWDNGILTGIARSMTDFAYACYLSDLAVAIRYQHQGIGKTLLHLTQQQLGPRCKLILIAAPDANDYYPQLGFSNTPRCWVLERNTEITCEVLNES